jgi:hypothetical protein
VDKINLAEFKSLDKENLKESILEFSSLEETQKRHRSLSQKDIITLVLEDYTINNLSISEISKRHSVSTSIIHKLLTDFYLWYFDDDKLQELIFVEPSSHLGVLYSFFNSVSLLSKEIAFNAAFSKKLREEIAKSLTENGLDKTIDNKKLMYAWRDSIRRNEILLKLAVEQTNAYLSLMEKVLDKQREVAFVKAIYEIMTDLDPSVAVKLYEKLNQDEYARALLESTSLDDFVNFVVQVAKRKNKILEDRKEIIDIDVKETE